MLPVSRRTVTVSIMRDSSCVIGGSAMAKSAAPVLSFSRISRRVANVSESMLFGKRAINALLSALR